MIQPLLGHLDLRPHLPRHSPQIEAVHAAIGFIGNAREFIEALGDLFEGGHAASTFAMSAAKSGLLSANFCACLIPYMTVV